MQKFIFTNITSVSPLLNFRVAAFGTLIFTVIALSFSPAANATASSNRIVTIDLGKEALLYRSSNGKFVFQRPVQGSMPIEASQVINSTDVYVHSFGMALSKSGILAVGGADGAFSASGIYTITSKSTLPELLLPEPDDNTYSTDFDTIDWSPDEKNLVLRRTIIPQDPEQHSTDSIVVYNISQQTTKTLTAEYSEPGPAFTPPFDIHFAWPKWSPDGKYIAFSADEITFKDPANDVQDSDITANIYLVATDCLTIPEKKCTPVKLNDHSGKRLTFPGSNRNAVPEAWFAPTWSPDGHRLAFGCRTLCIINRDGTHLLRLGIKLNRDLRYLTWSPDGKYIAYLDGDYPFIYNLSTNKVFALTNSRVSETEFLWATFPEANYLLPTPATPATVP